MMTTTRHDRGLETFANVVFAGSGVAAAKLRLQVARIAPHYRIALAVGERGTGKQVVAREMHQRSPVAQDQFVAMRIAEFVESEAAPLSRGTIYLHGLETSHPAVQQPLLHRIRRLSREVRLVAGCESDLRGMVATGRLRADLYDAVAMLELRLMPLRERLDDLEDMANCLLRRDGRDAWFAPSAVERMCRHAWPGNVEELARLCERLGDLDGGIEAHQLPQLEGAPAQTVVRLDQVMQKHVMDVLQRCSGNKLRAAELLGISRSTLYRMLETPVLSTR